MTNHEQKSLELLEEVAHLQRQLTINYRAQNLGEPGPHSRRIADLHQRINVSLKLADIHATLAIRQALDDVTVSA